MTARKKIEDPRPEHVEDLRLISEALWGQKEDRRWCGEFENYLRRWNQALSVNLPQPDPSIKAQFAIVYRFNLPYDADKNVQENTNDSYEKLTSLIKGKDTDLVALAAFLAEQDITKVENYDIRTVVQNPPADENDLF